MIHAYQEIYLSNAMSSMGEAFDYAVNDCGIPGRDFVKLLIGSPVCSRIENGEPSYLAGKSGIEIARECILSTTGRMPDVKPPVRFDRSPEYWGGWAVAYYQWQSSRKYSEIFRAISFDDLLFLYPTLHEADVSKFADVMEQKVRKTFPETNLKRLRVTYGCSQSELSRLSGVGLRSIQMYEQRKKDINKASAVTVRSLARALGCTMEDLIEK